MIKRKITRWLEQMREGGGKYALLIDGARQVGKTFIVRAFAKAHYEDFIEINFLRTSPNTMRRTRFGFVRCLTAYRLN